MIEVFLLGVLVAYTRLNATATALVGPALYALAGLMLVMIAADAWLDEHALWEAIGRVRRHPGADGQRPAGRLRHLRTGQPRRAGRTPARAATRSLKCASPTASSAPGRC